jgi:hypothetical protein
MAMKVECKGIQRYSNGDEGWVKMKILPQVLGIKQQ